MDGLGLCADPARRAAPAEVERTIERMGYVQVDTISVLERAHHHILLSRLDGYRPAMLTELLEGKRRLFEHWTHDASIIPAVWLPQWRARFAHYRRRALRANRWWAKRMGGEPRKVIAHVRRRIAREGPLRSRDFEHGDGERGPWWGWKPAKAALEYLWLTGALTIARREGFQKVYDLMDRVFPDAAGRAPSPRAHRDWACRTALERLGVATPKEIAGFFGAMTPADATAWGRDAVRRGEAAAVRVAGVDDAAPRPALARADWEERVRELDPPPERMRLLSPFDPLVRDRARALRLFGFDYRFEGFVPAPKRRYGYYVLPILEADRLAGRLDAKLHRDRGELVVNGVWWERSAGRVAERRRALAGALDALSAGIGATTWRLPPQR
jgi:hypothetical protein